MRAALIYNPSAGKGKGGAIAAAARSALVGRGIDAELHATQGPKHATAIAERLAPAMDILVAVGGDGTVNEVANGIARAAALPVVCPRTATPTHNESGDGPPAALCRTRLGIVPAGTVNVLALELKIPWAVDQACEVIARGETVALDLGDADGHSFVLMAGAGIDALTVRHVDPRAKRRYREVAFVAAGLRYGFAERQPVFVVRANGREHHATFVIAANSRYYAGRLSIARAADPTDGLLDLVVFTGTDRPGLAVFWLGIPSGLHLRGRNVEYIRASEADLVPLDDRDTIWLQTDGEPAGRLPAKVKVRPRALEVLVPSDPATRRSDRRK